MSCAEDVSSKKTFTYGIFRERREGGEVWWQEQQLGETVEGYQVRSWSLLKVFDNSQERNRQVRERVGETRQCLDLLEKMNTGKLEEENVLVDGSEDSISLLKQLEGSLAMEKACIIGHSFGGATTVMALAQDSRWFEL